MDKYYYKYLSEIYSSIEGNGYLDKGEFFVELFSNRCLFNFNLVSNYFPQIEHKFNEELEESIAKGL